MAELRYAWPPLSRNRPQITSIVVGRAIETGRHTAYQPSWAPFHGFSQKPTGFQMTDAVDLPNPSDSDVRTLMRLHNLSGMPVFIQYEDHGYEPRFCHLSAKDIAKKEAGRRVHGRAFWRFNATLPDGTRSSFVLAEHHSVWETPAGKLVDVTPPAHHPDTVLFLRDDSATIVSTHGNLLMLSDLSDFDKMPWFFGGLPITVPELIMPDEIRAQAGAYAKRIGFDMSDYPTDPTCG